MYCNQLWSLRLLESARKYHWWLRGRLQQRAPRHWGNPGNRQDPYAPGCRAGAAEGLEPDGVAVPEWKEDVQQAQGQRQQREKQRER